MQVGQPVVLVAVAQGRAHYQQALRKLVRASSCIFDNTRPQIGCFAYSTGRLAVRSDLARRCLSTAPGSLVQGANMAAHMQSGQLAVIDTLADADVLDEAELEAGAPELVSRLVHAISEAQSLPNGTHAASDAAAPSAASATASGAASTSPAVPAAGMQQAERSANGAQSSSEGGGGAARWSAEQQRWLQHPVCLLIDDLTAVGSLLADDAAWRGLLEKLQAILLGGQLPPYCDPSTGSHHIGGQGDDDLINGPVSLTTLLHSDVEDTAAAEMLMSQAANVIIDIEPLMAGQSPDVSGRMRMQLRRCTAAVPWGGFEGDPERCFFVKVSDRGVRFLQQYAAS